MTVMIADFRGAIIPHNLCSPAQVMSGEGECQGLVAQPRNRWATGIQTRFPQDWVVAALVEVDHHSVGFDLHHASGFYELAVHLLRGRFLEPVQLVREPPIAPV